MSWGAPRRRRNVRLAAGLLIVLTASAVNLLRAASWTQTDGFVWGPFADAAPDQQPAAPRPTSAIVKIDVVAPDWRPLEVSLPVASAGPGSVAVTLSPVPSDPGPTIDVAGASVLRARVETAAVAPYRVPIWLGLSAPAPAPVLSVGSPVVKPLATPSAIARHALAGAAFGLLIVLLLWPPARTRAWLDDTQATDDRTITTSARELWLVATGLLFLFSIWALVKPPYQSPDEVQHHLRATSLTDDPWVGGAWQFRVSPHFRNPLNWNHNELHAMVGRRDVTLSATEIAELRRTPWRPPESYPPVDNIVPSGIGSYPPGYYWGIFTIGQTATRLLSLDPYSSVLAYRFASILLATPIWVLVYRLLRGAPETTAYAVPVLLLLAANPSLASLTAAINPDAVNTPAIFLAWLAGWRLLSTGTGRWLFVLAALLALFTKPSGVMAMVAVVAAALVLGWAGIALAGRAFALARWAILTTAMAFAAFYAWSPPRLSNWPGRTVGLVEYASLFVDRIPTFWVQYWAATGWLEVGLPNGWYRAILVLVLGGLSVAVVQRASDRRWTVWVTATAAIFTVILLANEFRSLAIAWLPLQGRHFHPAALALAPALMLRQRPARYAIPVALLLMNVLLAKATVDRFFGGSIDALIASARIW